eukprot:2756657-Rhodomonas_salina.2
MEEAGEREALEEASGNERREVLQGELQGWEAQCDDDDDACDDDDGGGGDDDGGGGGACGCGGDDDAGGVVLRERESW